MTATTAPTEVSATSMKNNPRPWGLMLVQGILLVLVGGVLLWSPLKTQVNAYLLLVQLLGLWWLIEGFLDLVHMFQDHSAWGWKLFMGVVSIIAGSYILMYPIAAGIALPKIFVLVLGIWGLCYGIILLIMAFQGGGWGAGILGVLGIILGISLIGSYYLVGMGLAMIWTAAVFAVIGGIVLIIRAFQSR